MVAIYDPLSLLPGYSGSRYAIEENPSIFDSPDFGIGGVSAVSSRALSTGAQLLPPPAAPLSLAQLQALGPAPAIQTPLIDAARRKGLLQLGLALGLVALVAWEISR